MTSCRATRIRPAPSAARTEASCARDDTRESSRFARFTTRTTSTRGDGPAEQQDAAARLLHDLLVERNDLRDELELVARTAARSPASPRWPGRLPAPASRRAEPSDDGPIEVPGQVLSLVSDEGRRPQDVEAIRQADEGAELVLARIAEVNGQHADDGARLAVERDRAAENGSVAAEALLPALIRQHGDGLVPLAIFVRPEHASQDRLLASLQQFPGISNATLVSEPPLHGEAHVTRTFSVDHDTRPLDQRPVVDLRFVDPGYFHRWASR